MKKVIVNFFKAWKDPYFNLSFIQAASFLAFALILNYHAVRYATLKAGPFLPDFFLDNVPRFDTSFVDYYVALGMQYGLFIFILLIPRYSVFFLKCLSLLILVRSFFINLTGLGIPQGVTPSVSFFTQGGDLFFSGHTAIPFLAALIFWDFKSMRYLCFALSFFMGFSVLLGHYHYSIDVFAAPFIAYGVFSFSKILFNKDYDKMMDR